MEVLIWSSLHNSVCKDVPLGSFNVEFPMLRSLYMEVPIWSSLYVGVYIEVLVGMLL